MGGLKFDHAGAPLPAPLPVFDASDVSPKGSAGLVNQGSPETVAQVGPLYSDIASATQAAAMSKRDADQAVLDK
jgi:hypothetical protein